MTTWYSQGFVTAPTGPDSAPGSYGYDNGGFFGPQFANLGGSPFLVSWTATPCNCYGGGRDGPVFAATLTINDHSLELTAANNIGASEWLEQAGFSLLQLQTAWQQTATSPPFATTFYGNQYVLNTTGYNAYGQGVGSAYLLDINHPFPTNMFLDVSHMGPTIVVPGPDVGSGALGLFVAFALMVCWRLTQRASSA